MTLATGPAAPATPRNPAPRDPALRNPAPRNPETPLLAGARGSPLALIQTRDFLDRVRRVSASRPNPPHGAPPVFEEYLIRTTGDATQAAGTRLADIGGKGLFAKEIHEALADGRIDFAVHSLKDLESELPPGIILGCMLPREDPRDALILGAACTPANGTAIDPAD